jgi:nitrogen-specific signal transduction histidine kinase/CheY-like chemotaxis protein
MDLTARHQLERQLHHSQKMEAIGRLAGGVSHDFNNLLTVIQGFSEMALKRSGLDPAARHDLEEVHKAALRASDLTGQLLAFSRRQPVQPRIVDLNTLVADMAKMLQRLIGENIQLETRMGTRLGRLRIDPGQIEQVIANLVVNARDAMPSGGKLVIETANHSCTDGSGPRCRPSCPGPSVMLSVSDTGMGMDPETLRHIFEPFFTTKARGKGTGLGLSTVYGVVQQCGGDVEVVSESGRGTTFRVYLPLAATAAAEAPPPDPAGATPQGSETVLLVEDEDMVRALVHKTLERLGYEVLAARHGEEALELAEQRSGTIDLLLTDVVMPGLGGPEVARRLGATRPGLRVLYLSGYAAIEGERPAAAPLAPLLQKPFALDALARKVREVIDGGA